MATDARSARLPVAVWGFAAAKVVFHVATTRLDHHRDELYFIAASKRLAASYVDFQPVTPLLVRMARAIFGDSLIGLRLIPALAGVSVIVLAALIAREFGGDRRAQTFAAFALLVVPLFIGMDTAVTTVAFETPAWMLVAFFFVRTVRTSDDRWWVAVGAAIGLALLVKFTALGYVLGLVVAIAATSVRRSLRSPWLWVGALLAVVSVLPSIVWQFQHDLAIVEFVSHQDTGGRVLGLGGRLGYLVSLIVLPGPLALLLTIPGALWLWRSQRDRPLAIATATTLLFFLAASGKGYYAAPAIAIVLIAGAVAIVERRGSASRGVVIALVVNLLVPLPLLVPGVVPVSVLRESADIAAATEMGERLGWDDLAEKVADVAAELDDDERSRAFVVGSNYAIPTAVEWFSDDLDLPPAVSGHNSAYLWWPDDAPRDYVAIMVGFDRRRVEALFDDVRAEGKITNRFGVENYEWGDPVFVAREPRVSFEKLREEVKLFTA